MTGRFSSMMAVVAPRTVWIQSANSSALETVAERQTRSTSGGVWMITSSHTGPR